MPPISLEDVRRCAGRLCPLPSMARRETLPAGRVSLAGDKHQCYMFLCRLSTGAGHPGSKSGTCFGSNRSCRHAKVGKWDLVVGSVWVWLVPPFPSGFRPRIRARVMLPIAGMTNSVAGTIHPGSESGTCFRTNRPCRLVPAHQGRKIGCIGWWKGQVSSVHPTPPLAGDEPQRYISLATLGCRCSGDVGWSRRPVPEFIPDRSPGHAFVPTTHTRLVPLSLNSYLQS